MTRALLKKQLFEILSGFIYRRNGKKRKSIIIPIVIAIAFVMMFASFGFLCYTTASALCKPLYSVGLGWFYFAIAGLISIVAGVFGSIFTTYTSLYQAKDNDLLLSLPIPPLKILITRLAGVYIIGLLFEIIIMAPFLAVWFVHASPGVAGIIFSIIITILLSFVVLVLSCLLGWVIAFIASKVRSRTLITTLASLALVAVYYYFYFKATDILGAIISNPAHIAEGVRSFVYPIYQMGLAAEGDATGLLIFALFVIIPFALTVFALSKTFTRLATSNKGSKKGSVSSIEKVTAKSSVQKALFKKELKRFTQSTNYMLNCAIGVLFVPIAIFFLFYKGDSITLFLDGMPGGDDILPIALTGAACMISSMIDITAPSVSLEGRNLWIVRSLPVAPWEILKAKLTLHLIFSIPAMLILVLCAAIVFKIGIGYALLCTAISVLYTILMALGGLALNLRFVNVSWKNEVVPIKQSASVTFAVFGSIGAVAILALAYYLLQSYISTAAFMGITCAILALSDIFLLRLLKDWGCKRFETIPF